MGYSACKSPDAFKGRVVKLDANENNYGASPRVAKALGEFQRLSHLPRRGAGGNPPRPGGLYRRRAEHIVAGSGSDQLIDLLIRLFCAPGEEIINLPPTFAMFKFYADLQGAKVVSVPRDENYQIDVPGIKKAVSGKTKLIFIANPNNPTGTLTPEKAISRGAGARPAYGGGRGLLRVYRQNLCLSGRQNTQPHGAPHLQQVGGPGGTARRLRAFPGRVAIYLHAVRDPYNVNAAALVAARESLKDAASLRAR